MNHSNKYRVAVIGAGPAGIACAIQLKRYNIEPLLFEKNKIGGLLRNANFVENYPGFYTGITGPKLVNTFKKHLGQYCIKVINEEVRLLDYNKGQFVIKSNRRIYKVSVVVIASGTVPEKLSLKYPASAEHKIFYEIDELKNIHNKKIIIIGSGDAAFDYALSLAKNNQVIILNRSERFKCLPILYSRAIANDNIYIYSSIVVKSVKIKKESLRLECSNNRDISGDFLIIAIGRRANLDFLNGRLKNEFKKLEKQHKIYIIGDAKNKIYRQTGIAIGDGIKTAMEIALKNRKTQTIGC
ncbi:MAG: NAD(P)/FAD-dependent oxidoreductase [bacterium]